jgi:ribonuclease P protein component
MLPKKNRFTRALFEDFLATPGILTVYNKLGTLKYIPSGHKLGVVTSSKHEKRAVNRNKLRRRVYEQFKNANRQFSGILYASKASYTLEHKEIKELFNDLLRKAQYIK